MKQALSGWGCDVLNSGAEFLKNDDRLATVDPLTGMLRATLLQLHL